MEEPAGMWEENFKEHHDSKPKGKLDNYGVHIVLYIGRKCFVKLFF